MLVEDLTAYSPAVVSVIRDPLSGETNANASFLTSATEIILLASACVSGCV